MKLFWSSTEYPQVNSKIVVVAETILKSNRKWSDVLFFRGLKSIFRSLNKLPTLAVPMSLRGN